MKGLIDFLKIILGNIFITAAYACITVPNEIVNGGVTSFSMIVEKITMIDITIVANTMIIILLILCFCFLGKDNFVKSIFSSICYMFFFSIFSKLNFTISINVIVEVILAGIMVGIGYYFCICANSSAVGFDVVALILHKKNEKIDIASTMKYINIGVLMLALFSYGIIAIIFGVAFTIIQSKVLKVLLDKKAYIKV